MTPAKEMEEVPSFVNFHKDPGTKQESSPMASVAENLASQEFTPMSRMPPAGLIKRCQISMMKLLTTDLEMRIVIRNMTINRCLKMKGSSEGHIKQ